MNDEQPAQPLTDAELSQIRGYLDNTDAYGPRSVGNHNMLCRLLAEVDRLRAALHEAHRTVSAEEGRAAALEAVYRQTCTERDVRSAEIERLWAENTAQAAALAAVAAVADRIAPHAENMCRIGELEIGVPLRTAVRDIRSALGLDQDGNGQ